MADVGTDPDKKNDAEGIRCPNCHCRDLPVLFTRHVGNYIRRRRECRHCGRQLTTTEKLVADEKKVH